MQFPAAPSSDEPAMTELQGEYTGSADPWQNGDPDDTWESWDYDYGVYDSGSDDDDTKIS